eukprot:INCI19051.13.p1 GENE.INCI19051.13~~INCI19051.13.p1  ORF type:complete len:107 (+),score=10.63 INCI19051.13:101-421(+)
MPAAPSRMPSARFLAATVRFLRAALAAFKSSASTVSYRPASSLESPHIKRSTVAMSSSFSALSFNGWVCSGCGGYNLAFSSARCSTWFSGVTATVSAMAVVPRVVQ